MKALPDWWNWIWQAMPPAAWAANTALATFFLLIGGLVFNWGPKLVHNRRIRAADFSGEWENLLYSPENELVKRDTLEVFQKGDTLYGNISRDKPESEKNRRFEFRGQLKADRFVAAYWAVDQTVNRAGSWHVRLVSDGYYSGLYVTVTPDNRIVAKRLDFRRKSSSPPDWLNAHHAKRIPELTIDGVLDSIAHPQTEETIKSS